MKYSKVIKRFANTELRAPGEREKTLEQEAPRLVREAEAKEDARMSAAILRAQYPSQSAYQAHIEKLRREAATKNLADSNLPTISTFDAYSIIKDATKAYPDDRGLKEAEAITYRAWSKDLHGSLTVGFVDELRRTVLDRFPKSAAKKVIDTGLIETGFHTLTDLGRLNHVASEIHDQSSYEHACEVLGIDGNEPNHLRARAYLKAASEQHLSDSPFELAEPPSSVEMYQRLAQALESGDYQSPEELSYEDVMGDDPAGADGADSSGLDSSDGMNDEDELGHEEDLGDEESTSDSDPDGDGDEDFDSDAAELGNIESPVSGEELRIKLMPMEDDQGVDLDSDRDGVSDTDGDASSDGFELGKSKSAQVLDQGQAVGDGVEDHFDGEDMPDSDEDMPVPASEDAPDAAVQEGQPVTTTTLVDPTSGQELELSLKVKAMKFSKNEIRNLCASQQLTPKSVEEKLLSGEWVYGGRSLAAGISEYAIGMDDRDHVVLARYQPDGEVEKILRDASMARFDETVGEFMSFVAASLVFQAERKAQLEERKDYLLTTSVPKKAGKNARAIVAQVKKIVPEVDAELDGGTLRMFCPQASLREVNRLNRLLTDMFEIREFSAAVIAQVQPTVPGAAVSPEGQQRMELGDTTENSIDPNSPYVGPPPVKQTPAGTPAPAQTAPAQTMATGSQAQANFIDRHTDPLKGTGIKAAKKEPKNPYRKAQVEAPAAPVDMPSFDPGAGEDSAADAAGEDVDSAGADMSDLAAVSNPEISHPAESLDHMLSGDAAQTPLDVNGGTLHPEDQEVVKAVMVTSRNQGMLPLEALKDFSTKFSGILDKYGDENSPERAEAEAAVIRAMAEAWQKPSVVPSKS